jgi:hypothetical protein
MFFLFWIIEFLASTRNVQGQEMNRAVESEGRARLQWPMFVAALNVLSFDATVGLISTPMTKFDRKICILGGGASGLAVLKALRETKHFQSGKWQITVLERRSGVGGTWCVYPTL